MKKKKIFSILFLFGVFLTVMTVMVLKSIVSPIYLGAEDLLSGKSKFQKKEYTSAKVCKECHPKIYTMWNNSMHAHTMDDPIFEATYALAYTKTGGNAAKICLRCHAPTTTVTKDFNQKLEITREGVTCDFCHTITGVDLSNRKNPFIIKKDQLNIKAESVRDTNIWSHNNEQSDILGSSEFCAGCHDYTDENDVLLMGTFTEWKEGPYPAQDVGCQDCHMSEQENNLKDHRMMKFRGGLSGQIALPKKSLPGNSEVLQVGSSNVSGFKIDHDAISVKLNKVERSGGHLKVVVQIANTGYGHMVPTGMPSRSLILICEVRTSPKGELMTRKQVYKKRVVYQANGEEITDDADLMLKPSRIIDDNRLAPNETRTEEFKFMVSSDQNVIVSASVSYLYNPVLIHKTEMKIHISRDEKMIPAQPGR